MKEYPPVVVEDVWLKDFTIHEVVELSSDSWRVSVTFNVEYRGPGLEEVVGYVPGHVTHHELQFLYESRPTFSQVVSDMAIQLPTALYELKKSAADAPVKLVETYMQVRMYVPSAMPLQDGMTLVSE